MLVRWIVTVATAACLISQIHGQLSDSNTPPMINVNQDWELLDSWPVGTILMTIHGEDPDQDELIYGLEAKTHHYDGQPIVQKPLPFSINNQTGTIFVNETLKGRAGEVLMLFVTAFDGKLTTKTEVIARIKNSLAPNRGFPGLFSPPRGSGKVPGIMVPGFAKPPLIPTTTDKKITKLRPAPSNFDEEKRAPATITTTTTTTLPPVRPPQHIIETNEIEQVKPVIDAKVPQTNEVTASTTQDLAITILLIIFVCAVLLGGPFIVWTVRQKFCGPKKTKEDTKEQASVRVSTISHDASFMSKNWKSSKFQSDNIRNWDKIHQNSDKKHKDDKWEFPRHRLKVFNILGEGCFGQVWKSEAIDIDSKSGPTIVAIKTLKENATERERLDLTQELKVMKSLEPHPNVVRLLGCCTEREPIFVILEYVSGGKLQSFLRTKREERNHGGPGLTSRDLTSFVYQVAKGMEYLASKGIIHRDLAARNILIDDTRACKVADFGFARDLAANQIYERKSEGRLPIRWMAPESLYDNIFSVKSDIWSFGVLIWEIVTLGSTPYPGMAAAEVMRKIKEGYRLDRPEHCKRELYNIMYYCWDKDPSCRPSFTELVNLAEGLLLDETDYIELDRFPDHSYYNVLNLSGEKL